MLMPVLVVFLILALLRLEGLESQSDLIKRLTEAAEGIAACRKAMQSLGDVPPVDRVEAVLQNATWHLLQYLFV